jgi:hypothetical protein
MRPGCLERSSGLLCIARQIYSSYRTHQRLFTSSTACIAQVVGKRGLCTAHTRRCGSKCTDSCVCVCVCVCVRVCVCVPSNDERKEKRKRGKQTNKLTHRGCASDDDILLDHLRSSLSENWSGWCAIKVLAVRQRIAPRERVPASRLQCRVVRRVDG